MKVRYERTVREPNFKAGVEGETKDIPQHLALELAAEGYVTLLDKPVHVPTPAEIDAAEATRNAETVTLGEADESTGESANAAEE